MIGTIVNTSTILLGSCIGSVAKKGIQKKYEEGLFTAMGMAAVALGINSIARHMPNSKYPVLFIISLALGSLIGIMLDLDGRFQRLTTRFGTSDFSKGLSTAIMLFCIGTMSILGPVESAINGNNTFLFTNATMDFVSSIVFASTYGIGIAVSAIILFLWQGGIYLCANVFGGFITEGLMTEISIIGGILIASSGLSILKLKDCKTLNMLPSLVVAMVIYHILNIAA